MKHIVQMDPEDRAPFALSDGTRWDLEDFRVLDRGFLPFHGGEVRARLDKSRR